MSRTGHFLMMIAKDAAKEPATTSRINNVSIGVQNLGSDSNQLPILMRKRKIDENR
jgi:hypothetical protein